MLSKLLKRFEKHVITRSKTNDEYLTRWIIWGSRTASETRPRPAVYLHQFHRSDADEMHNHPWPFVSVILWGGYWERTPATGWTNGDGPTRRRWYGPGRILWRPHGWIHSVDIPAGKTAFTLFIRGIKRSSWGFFCPRIGFINWREHQLNLLEKGSGCE